MIYAESFNISLYYSKNKSAVFSTTSLANNIKKSNILYIILVSIIFMGKEEIIYEYNIYYIL